MCLDTQRAYLLHLPPLFFLARLGHFPHAASRCALFVGAHGREHSGECDNFSSATQSLASPVDCGFLINMIRESEGILWISFLKNVTSRSVKSGSGDSVRELGDYCYWSPLFIHSQFIHLHILGIQVI